MSTRYSNISTSLCSLSALSTVYSRSMSGNLLNNAVGQFLSPHVDLDCAKSAQERHLQSSVSRRCSHDSDASWTHVPSRPASDSGVPNQLRESQAANGMSRSEDVSVPPASIGDVVSANLPQPAAIIHEKIGPWKSYAHGRGRFIELSGKWMSKIEKHQSTPPNQLNDESEFSHLQQLWLELQSCSLKLDEWEALHPPADLLSGNGLEIPRPNIGHEAYYPTIVVDEPLESNASSAEPDFADLFYHHASAVRWCSDDLINLGPRPSEHNDLHRCSDESYEITDHMTHQEYAERHLEILNDMAHHRDQALFYKKICMEKGIELEDNVDDDTDNLSENLYQSLVDNLGSAAPRIDSMVAIRQSQQVPGTTSPALGAGSAADERIAEWTTSLPEAYEPPPSPQIMLQPPIEPSLANEHSIISLSLLDPTAIGQHGQNDGSRHHHRRTKSSTYPPTLANSTKPTRPRAMSTGPCRKGSGIGLGTYELRSAILLSPRLRPCLIAGPV